MSTDITTTAAPVTDRPATRPAPDPGDGRAAAGIPLLRLARVELRKMVDTRAGLWLMASILGAAVLASSAIVAFAPDASVTYGAFLQAIGFPMAIILPIVAILAVAGEYSQRSVLTTFTLEPRRGRVVLAKALAVAASGVVAVLVTIAVGALGAVVGAAINGTDPVWDVSAGQLALMGLGMLVAMAMGFTFGTVFRASAGAISAYFVYSLALPVVLDLLSVYQEWFADLRPWVDFNLNANSLFAPTLPEDLWVHLGASGVLWLVLPLAYGVRRILRTEVS